VLLNCLCHASDVFEQHLVICFDRCGVCNRKLSLQRQTLYPSSVEVNFELRNFTIGVEFYGHEFNGCRARVFCSCSVFADAFVRPL
jgi:hypothetical protein